MQPHRGRSSVCLLSVLLHLLIGTSGVVIKKTPSSSADNAPNLNLVKKATGSLTGSFVTDVSTPSQWLNISLSTGALGPTSTLQNLHGPSFIIFRSSAESTVLDSWLLHGRGSVQQLVGRLGGMLLPRQFPLAQSTALLQTAHGQPAHRHLSASEEREDQYRAFVALLISSVVTLVLAFFYWRHRKPPERQLDAVLDEGSFKAWRFGLFSCFSEPEICLWACCCPAIRWADTMRQIGYLGFWMAFAVFFGISVVASATGAIAIWAVLAFVCAAMRQEMRLAYGMYEQGGCTYFEDFCLYCFCSCCTIIQEARQVEEAYKVGYPIEVRPLWDPGAEPSSAHVQGAPAHHPTAARMQDGNSYDQP